MNSTYKEALSILEASKILGEIDDNLERSLRGIVTEMYEKYNQMHTDLKNELNKTIRENREERESVFNCYEDKLKQYEEMALYHKNKYEEVTSSDIMHRLEVKLMNRDELLVLEGSDCINQPDFISQQLNSDDTFVDFGYIGVRKSEIEWYAITKVEPNEYELKCVKSLASELSDFYNKQPRKVY